jgi:phenylalanyl-tRNA synthetase beta chain
MKFALSTLKEYLSTNASLAEICSKLTDIGLEVENIEDKSQSLSYFSVAEIIGASKVPNSSKLTLCEVKISQNEILQVVCGASNARAGIKVAFAPIGAIIPASKMVIKKAKIAGVESSGMLCSATELGLEGGDDGIIEIDHKFEIGQKIVDVFNLGDPVIEINVTPNRGDCLGVYGIARDLAATKIGDLKPLLIKESKADFTFEKEVIIVDEVKNTMVFFRQLKNIKNCQSPAWLKDKLSAVGINSVSAIVDVTNYMLHVSNRPMHAYDISRIDGSIDLRYAKNQEKFTSLKNEDFELADDILVFSNQQKIISLAGIMGGNSSACDMQTSDILLEAAYFDPSEIALAGRKLNINSDSRYRFERGVDIKTCKAGIEFATNLIKEICQSQNSEAIIISDIKSYKSHNLQSDLEQNFSSQIEFNFDKFSKLIGIELPKEQMIEILQRLEFKILEISDHKLSLSTPTHRHDIKHQDDLIEEIIRIHGYNKINSTPLENKSISNLTTSLDFCNQARLTLAALGMKEIISWSFVDSKIIDLFATPNPELILTNPISIELNYMRPNLAIGLLQTIQKNQSRNFNDLSLFEIGQVFEGINIEAQKLMIAGVRTGKNKETDSYNEAREFDIFDAKKDLLSITEICGLKSDSIQIDSTSTPPKYYHPHRSATLKLGNKIIGYFGEIHPLVTKKFDLKNRANFFEIFVDNLPNHANNLQKLTTKKALKINDLQPVIRDFAFIFDQQIKAGEIIKLTQSIDKTLIEEVTIFDIYSGQNIPSNKKSIAIKVKIQPQEKTLTSEEIDNISKKIIENITKSFGGTLRE